MQKFLDLSENDQRTAFAQAAAARGLTASIVEKDFWVCWALSELFQLPLLKGSLIFKGGTSLSKVWGLIDRFSEDIDLTIDRKVLGFDGEHSPEMVTGKRRKKLLKELRTACKQRVEEVRSALANRLAVALNGRTTDLRIDEDDPDGQTLLLRYPVLAASAPAGYVAPVAKIEFGARSDPWPTEQRTIRSFVAEAFPNQFGTADATVEALLPTRTFWEKAMLLHEETYRPAGRKLKLRMARHYYDLYRLIEAGIGKEAIEDQELFRKVAEHREVYFEQTWMNYDTIKPGALRIVPLPDQESVWRDDYSAMGAEMFQSTPPTFDTVLELVRRFQDTFNKKGK